MAAVLIYTISAHCWHLSGRTPLCVGVLDDGIHRKNVMTLKRWRPSATILSVHHSGQGWQPYAVYTLAPSCVAEKELDLSNQIIAIVIKEFLIESIET